MAATNKRQHLIWLAYCSLKVCEMFWVGGVSMTQVAVSILQVRYKAVKVVQFSVFTYDNLSVKTGRKCRFSHMFLEHKR